MPSLRGSRHLGKEGRSPRATESMFEVPQARSSQRIKTVSILLEEKTRLEAQSGEGGWEGGGRLAGLGGRYSVPFICLPRFIVSLVLPSLNCPP